MLKRKKGNRILLTLLPAAILIGLFSVPVFAQYSSSNYKAQEVQFGAGAGNGTSANYQSQASVGSLGVGRTSSANYQAFSGFLTPNEPFLEMGIDSGNVNLGLLDTGSTKYGSATFHVRAYLNSGYTVQTVSDPPTLVSTNTHTLAPMTSQGDPIPGTEQFGINLVANTVPGAFGANPSPQPDSSYATGQAASGYNTTNKYKYNKGDTIAQTSTSGWGLTDFTISYIANISVLTPAGYYSMNHDLVAVATY